MNDIVIFKTESQYVEVRLAGGIWVAQKKLKAWLPLAQKKRTDFPRKNRWRAGDSAWLRDNEQGGIDENVMRDSHVTR